MDKHGRGAPPSGVAPVCLAVAGGKQSAVMQIDAMLTDIVARERAPAGALAVTSSVFAFILDMLSTPVLVVDRHLRIVFANAAAATELTRGGVLGRCGDQLIVASAQAAAFADYVSAAGRGCPIKRSLILPGAASSAVAVWFRPVDATLQTSALLWSRGLVAVTFRPLRRHPVLSKALLCRHFGLTSKEAEVLAHLAFGASIRDVAKHMGVKLSTVRSHLSKCFQKTGTHRQPDLVSLALSLTSPVQE